MRGVHDSKGNVTITFNSQHEALLASDADSKYLPCCECGHVLGVPLNVVSAVCEPGTPCHLPYVVRERYKPAHTNDGRIGQLYGVHCKSGHEVVHGFRSQNDPCGVQGCACTLEWAPGFVAVSRDEECVYLQSAVRS